MPDAKAQTVKKVPFANSKLGEKFRKPSAGVLLRQQQNKLKYVLLAGPVPAKSTQGGRECARKGARFGRIFEPNACIRFERLSFFDSLSPERRSRPGHPEEKESR